MLWQDYVISGAQLVLTFGLLPSVFGQNKPALSTSLLSGSALLIISVVFSTLSLWLSTFLLAAQCVLWYILAFQKFYSKKH